MTASSSGSVMQGSERGFLYIEVLVSMAILAFALLATAPLFVIAGRENAAASDLTFASTIAQDCAENLKRTAYADLASGQDMLRLRSMEFDRTWVVTNDTPHVGMKTVTVTVVPRRRSTHGANRIATLRFYRVP